MTIRLLRTIDSGVDLTFPHGVGVTDIDNNGKPELTAIRFTFPGGNLLDLSVLEFQSDGRVINRVNDLVLGSRPKTDFGRDILVKDVNNDGHEDIIIADHGFDASPFPGARNLVLLSDGAGHLVNRSRQFSDATDFTHSLAAGDFDGDGRQDILFNNFGVDLPLMLSVTATGTSAPFPSDLPFGGHFTTATASDLRNIGRDDLVLGASQQTISSQSSLIASYRNDTWTLRELPNPIGIARFIAEDSLVTDLNGDGIKDILFLHTSNIPFSTGWRVQVLQGNAKGSYLDRTDRFFSETDFLAPSPGAAWAQYFFLDDLNNEGRDDLLVQTRGDAPHMLFLQNAFGRFHAESLPTALNFGQLAIVDTNGDGRNEIASVAERNISVLAVDPAPGSVSERLTGTDGVDRISGGRGNDSLTGLGNDDLLVGGIGQDRLGAGTGSDTLLGGGGADVLTGGKGVDVFRFLQGDIRAGERITDFKSGTDKIDVSGIDARNGGPDTDFAFIGSANFAKHPGTGEIRYERGILRFNTDRDDSPEFTLEIAGSPALRESDFLL